MTTTETNLYNKTLFISLLTLLYIFPTNIYSQQAKFKASVGVSLSQIDNDGMSGYHKNGLTAGLATQFPFKKNMLWSIGIKYVNKGSKKIYGDMGQAIGGNGQWEIARLQYIDVPLTYTYIYKDKFYVSTGPVIGVLAGGNIEFTPFIKYDARDAFKRIDIAWNFSVAYNFSTNWLVQIVSQESIISANKNNNHSSVSRYAGYLNNNILIEVVRVFDSR